MRTSNAQHRTPNIESGRSAGRVAGRVWCGIVVLLAAVAAAPPGRPRPAATRPTATRPTTGPTAGVEADAAALMALAPSARGPASTRPAAVPATLQAATPPAAATRPARASNRPDPQATPIPAGLLGPVSDAEIEAALRRGIDVLLDQFDARTHRLRRRQVAKDWTAMETGLDALCVYALMQANLAAPDPRLSPRGPFVRGILDALKKMPADVGVHQTYARSLRAAALAAAGRPEDKAALDVDVGCLVYGHEDGAYGYRSATPVSSSFRFDGPGTPWPNIPITWFDNSNSQYGLLGVWSGAEAGVDLIPSEYWKTVERHWTELQTDDGRWTYRWKAAAKIGDHPQPGGSPSLSMTAAGTASLLVAREYVEADKPDLRCGRDPYPDPLAKALAWWEEADHSVNLKSTGSPFWGYALFGVERVGLASGYKFFGRHDWYAALARQTIDRQQDDGSWGDLLDTAYSVLFLSRGRHPILMNKLRFDGKDDIQPDFWANRPRDAAYLSRYASAQLERALNWQIVPLNRDFTDWLDSPILYIASHRTPRFRDADYDKLRQFVQWGGMIYTQTDNDEDLPATPPAPGVAGTTPDPLDKYLKPAATTGPDKNKDPGFDVFVAALAARLFPDYPFQHLPTDHPLYSSLHRLDPKPKLKAVSNGSRLLLVHSPQDLARTWQLRDVKKGKPAFDFGVNLFVYAAGKRDYRNRLNSPWVPAPDPDRSTGGRVAVARLRYPGNWDPEPMAWPRFARRFQWDTGTGVDVAPIPWSDLTPAAAPVAHLTGTAAYAPSAREVAALRSYVQAGGVLLIDDTGGGGAFAASLLPALKAAFPGVPWRRLPAGHLLVTPGAPGMQDVAKPRLRLYCAERPIGGRDGSFEVMAAGKGHVVLTSFDLTTGLLGTGTWGVVGYDPSYAEAFAGNLVFWTLDGQPDR